MSCSVNPFSSLQATHLSQDSLVSLPFPQRGCTQRSIREPAVDRVSMLWDQVAKIRSVAEVEGSVTWKGKAYPSLMDAQRSVFEKSTAESELLKNFIFPSEKRGTVLDLGCGVGANSVFFAEKGWKVFALDRDEVLLNLCRKSVLEVPNLQQPPEMILGDITRCEFPDQVDIVVCTDVLPYISPQKMEATMKKIHQAIRPQGFFIGSLLFLEKLDRNQRWIDLTRGLGAHFYPTKEMALDVVSHSGFKIEYSPPCIVQSEEIVVDFVASKTSKNP